MRSKSLWRLLIFVAAALAATLETDNSSLTAGGFQDTTRIAAGDPELWTAILLANADEVAAGLRTFSASLQDLLRAIDSRDKRQLTELLTTAKRNRDGLASKTDEPASSAKLKGSG